MAIATPPGLDYPCRGVVSLGAQLICPKCRFVNARRSQRRGAADSLGTLLGLRPWRCRSCQARFYAWSVPPGFVLYAHCSECGNLDLQRVDRAHVDRGPLRRLWSALRVPAYRCAHCRRRFFSLRPAYPVATLPGWPQGFGTDGPGEPEAPPPAAP